MSDTYHHGDLRRALLDEAANVLDAEGVGALSLRELARRTGVSATAPYHHFKGKPELIHALVEDILIDLDAVLGEADAAHTEPGAQLSAQGVAYVLFAVDNPERFRLAFRPEIGLPFASLGQAGGHLPEDLAGFRHLVRAVRRLVSGAEAQASYTIAAWSLVHGLASLLVDGPLRALAADRDRVRVLAESSVAHLCVDVHGERTKR